MTHHIGSTEKADRKSLMHTFELGVIIAIAVLALVAL